MSKNQDLQKYWWILVTCDTIFHKIFHIVRHFRHKNQSKFQMIRFCNPSAFEKQMSSDQDISYLLLWDSYPVFDCRKRGFYIKTSRSYFFVKVFILFLEKPWNDCVQKFWNLEKLAFICTIKCKCWSEKRKYYLQIKCGSQA